MRERALRWLYGLPNMVGMVLAIAGIVLFIAGVISGTLVVPIVVGLFAVERTVTDYLPTTLNAYLRLPKAYASTRVIRSGKTASALLGEQLDLIDEKMQEVAEAVAKDDVGKLLAQGRFLEERFKRNDELNISPGAGA